jgi:hypothetical protein
MGPSRQVVSGRSPRHGERGVTLVVMALMLTLALGMSALAIDYGMIKSAKAEAQRAMDAAALAGASAFLIPDPTVDKVAEAEARARDYAKKHAVHRVAITDPEVEVVVDLPNETITASYNGGGIPLWFATMFGSNTMAVHALAAAHVALTSKAACVMPVAIPDIWHNVNTAAAKKNDPDEDVVPDGLWNFNDKNHNGVLDEGERELWEFDLGEDVYDQALYGYGSSYRNGMGGGDPMLNKTNDYGRQITLMTLSPKDGTVSSNYYAWGYTKNDANSAEVVANKIKTPDCQVATIGGDGYEYDAGNGGQIGPISDAWNTRVGYDPGATWDDNQNRVTGSEAGNNWLTDSPRVVIVALYNPYAEMTAPSDNKLVFNNFAKVFLDKRPPGCDKSCKDPITGRFLGFLGGPGGGPVETGTLIKTLQLIK